MPAALMIGHHFSISALCSAASAAGVCSSRGTICCPASAARWRTPGSANALTAAALSLAMTSLGVPLGANSAPDRAIKPWQSGLVYRWNIRRRSKAAVARHCISLDASATDLRQGCRLVSEYQVDPPGYQILHRHHTAAVGHEPKMRAGGVLEKDCEDVLRASHAGGPHRGHIRIGLQPGDQALDVVCRHGFPGDDDLRV